MHPAQNKPKTLLEILDLADEPNIIPQILDDMQKNDEKIAIFLGYTKEIVPPFKSYMVVNSMITSVQETTLYRHPEFQDLLADEINFRSYVELMRVIRIINQKCKETGYPDGLTLPSLRVINSGLKEIYDAVIEYIDWYNENIL